MTYADESTRIDVANSQFAVHRALDDLQQTLRYHHFDLTDSTAKRDSEIVRWTTFVDVASAIVDMLAGLEPDQIDPYAEQDARIAAQYEADLSAAAAEEPHPLVPRAGTDCVSASPSAPTPRTHGHGAFGTSHLIPPLETVNPRGLDPDNPFANPFAGPLNFGYVDPSQTEQETAR